MFDLPPSNAIAVGSSVTGDLNIVPTSLPGSGLAKAQGLYQFAFVFVFAAHVTPGLFTRSGLPPEVNGSRTLIALAPPPAAVLLSGETVNGVPVWAANVRRGGQPPITSSSQSDLFRYALP